MDYWGGKYVSVQSMWQTRGVRGHAPPGNFVFFDLLVDAIWWNLGLFFTQA